MFPNPRAKMVSEVAVLPQCCGLSCRCTCRVSQRDSMAVEDMEPEIQAKIAGRAARVYFNKGLEMGCYTSYMSHFGDSFIANSDPLL